MFVFSTAQEILSKYEQEMKEVDETSRVKRLNEGNGLIPREAVELINVQVNVPINKMSTVIGI